MPTREAFYRGCTLFQPKPADNNKLTRRADGRYVKKIRGKIHYFGTDHDAALAEWLRVKDDLLAGREPRSKPHTAEGEIVTLEYARNKFLTDKLAERDAGQLSPTTWIDYERLCKRLVRVLGGWRAVSDLGPMIFVSCGRTCRKLADSHLFPTIIKVRTVFNHRVADRIIANPPFYGTAFDLPSAKERRTYRARQEAEYGKKLFEAAELVKLIDTADVHLRAMIYLGINCGYGNADVAGLSVARSTSTAVGSTSRGQNGHRTPLQAVARDRGGPTGVAGQAADAQAARR